MEVSSENKVGKDRWLLWHRRLGHVGNGRMKAAIRADSVRGLPKLSMVEDYICEPCVMAKMVRKKFKRTGSKFRAKCPLELLHIDLIGPVNLPSKGGARYVMVIVDDYSRM